MVAVLARAPPRGVGDRRPPGSVHAHGGRRAAAARAMGPQLRLVLGPGYEALHEAGRRRYALQQHVVLAKQSADKVSDVMTTSEAILYDLQGWGRFVPKAQEIHRYMADYEQQYFSEWVCKVQDHDATSVLPEPQCFFCTQVEAIVLTLGVLRGSKKK